MSELWLKVAVWRMLSDRATAGYRKARTAAEDVMPRGARWPVELEDGTKVGTVSRSAPGKVAHVSAPDLFLAWAKEHYPDDVEPELEIVGSPEQVKAALYEHARELVKAKEVVSQSLRATVIDASAAYGAPAGPNGELDVPGISVGQSAPGRVSFLPTDGAYDVLAELVRAGKVEVPSLLDDPDAVPAP